MTVIDAHAHLETRMLEVPALIEKMKVAGIDKVVLIPCMNDVFPHTPDGLLAFMRFLMNSPFRGLARKIAESMFTVDGIKLNNQIYKLYPLPDNQTVADVMTAHPDLFLGWIFLNPKVMEDPLGELDRWRVHKGFVGVKLHPYWHRYKVELALPIAKRCEELGLPILIHMGFGDHGDWRVIADKCPKLKLMFAHAGMPHWGELWPHMRGRENIFVDVSSPYLSERLVRHTVKALGPSQVIYGTDAPYGFPAADHSYDYLHIKGWVERLPVSSAGVEQILARNVERLLATQR